MKWISNLLRRPAAQPPSPPSPTTPGTPKADPDAPRPDDAPAVHADAVCHAQDKRLALGWLADLHDQDALGTVAVQARSGEVRLAAARRIDADEVLERVALASRDKDKRVHRHCAELLRLRRAAQADARRGREIADQLRALLETSPQSLSQLMALQKAVGELAPDGGAGEECGALLEAAFARLREETEVQRRLHVRLDAARRLQAELGQARWPWSDRLPGWRAGLEALKQETVPTPAWLAALSQALAAALDALESGLAGLAADDNRVDECERYLAALEHGDTMEGGARERWQALPRPASASAAQALEARWQALSTRLQPAQAAPAEAKPATEAVPDPRPAPKLDQDALRGQLDGLAQAVGAGHLADAEAAARRIKALVAGQALRGALESRWHGLQAELETLRGWARWGTGQAREKLIADAQALLAGEPPVEQLAEAVPALREAWKRLDAHAPASKAQWEGFDATLEKAYAPVAARRAEQAARQAEARTAREALCAGWEADTTWQQADFKSVEARRADLISQWRAAPQAGFRDERALRKRFDPLIEAIDRHLDAARSAEQLRREQIIQAAEALAGETDSRRAVAEAKALQQAWSGGTAAVRLRRADEQKLWQRFRSACDAVFARLDAQRAEQTAQRAQLAEARQKLLDDFAATVAGGDAAAIRQAMAGFQTEWDAARPAGRGREERRPDPLETRARAQLDEARQRLEALRRAREQARYDVLARKSALAERVETAVLADEATEAMVAEVMAAWAQLPGLPGSSERRLAQRLAEASRITPQRLADCQARRESLLLDLEIALGLPSPDHCADTRRERQLARLQDRFGPAAEQPQDPEDLLARWYATPASANPSEAPRLAAIVRHLSARPGAA